MDSLNISPQTKIWIDKEGNNHIIPLMADLHLFSVMENLLKVARMQRRKESEYLASLIEMYDTASEGYLSPETKEIKAGIEKHFDTIMQMNTDAYGSEHLDHYEDIMIEASFREMREPYEPIYDKTTDANPS